MSCHNVPLQGDEKAAQKLTELEKQAKEREGRESKLKQLVLKAKKEASEYKNKVCTWY